jgi:antitoxin component YwqK of YwqJK toxin-antitoxin module
MTTELEMDDGMIVYWPNGRIRQITRKRNNQLHGLQQYWYENGQLGYDRNYEHGEWHGRH